MIVRMDRVRIMGRHEDLDRALAAIQDLEVLHLAQPRAAPGLRVESPSEDQVAQRAFLETLIDDLEVAEKWLPPARRSHPPLSREDLPAWGERARDLRAQLETLAEKTRALDEEWVLLERYRDVVHGFQPLLARIAPDRAVAARYLVVRADQEHAVHELQRALGEDVRVHARRLAGGEVAVALVASEGAEARVDELLRAASLEDLPAPEAYGGGSLLGAMPKMLGRLAEIPGERDALEAARRAFGEAQGPAVQAALAAAHDRLAALDAIPHAANTGRAFVLEGFVPYGQAERLDQHLAARLGPLVGVERVAVEEWGDPAPVELRNPRLFSPFEVLTGLLPLPAYGTIDPTPFVAISFPMLFGIILGDVGYGVMLGLLSAVVRWRSAAGSVWRSLSAVGGACALFTVVFGVLYGELFGDLGTRLWGWHAVLLQREEAIVPAIVLALGIGVIHLLLGLLLGVFSAIRGEPRKAVGRGLAALMLVLIVIALLAVFGVLPRAVFTPVLAVAVIAFPILVVLEGLLAPIEMLSTLSHVLSYARIMAVGTASVMMAVVANRIAGAFGSVLVGVLFALLFHLVNFAIGVFGPAVHVLRLHYVEFFGEFYSPGGVPYRPLGHWHGRAAGGT